MDDDDLDFGDDFGESKKKSNARQGRRAARAAPPPEPDPIVEDNAAEEESLPAANSAPRGKSARDTDGPPRPRRQMGGWGDNRNDSMDDWEDARLRPQTAGDSDQDSDPDIPVIPDLEDQQADEEYMSSAVAMAPSVAINRVATYRELDNDLLSHAQFLTLDNEIDLKLLAKCLSAEGDVAEADKPWDWERLFTEVTSELLTEWEKKEEKAEEDDLDVAVTA